MKMKRFAPILLILILLLIPAGIILAAPPFDTVVSTGDIVPNDVVLLDGDVEVQEGATVNGSVTLFNGDAIVAGKIEGDLVLFNGKLDAASTAVITGDCVLLNGTVTDATAGGLGCTNVDALPDFFPALANFPDLPDFLNRPEVRVGVPSAASRFFSNLGQAFGRSLLLGFLAFIAASLLPEHLTQVEEAVRRKPVASGTVGLLTAVAVPSLVALLLPLSLLLTIVCIGLLGFPIMLALLLGLVAGSLLGWIAVGNMLGQRLVGPLKLKNRTLPVTAALGTAILTFVIGLMGFGEGVITFLIVCIGLGGAALTKFGTKPYPMISIENKVKVAAALETLPR
jgi:hypothetical protein